MANYPCPRCGQLNNTASGFCGQCGARLAGPQAAPSPVQGTPVGRPPKSRKKLFIFGGLALALVFAGIFLFVTLLLLVGLSSRGHSTRSRSKSAPDGLYIGTEGKSQFNMLTGNYNYNAYTYYYYFLTDGRYCYGLPRGGTLDDFDPDRAQQSMSCGTYRIANGQIKLFPKTSTVQTYNFTFHGDTLQLAGTTYSRVQPADGLRLGGTYSQSRYTDTSSALGSGGVSGETFFKFTPDGRFTEHGFTGFAGSTEDVGATASQSAAASGTYSISGNTLTLNFSDGRKQRVTFFVNPEDPDKVPPTLIYLDGGAYMLRK